MLAAAFALAGAAPAMADSTVSASVPGGGSLRSSPDAAPSPANPVIVTVTTAEDFKQDGSGCHTNCSDGPSMVTITMKSKHDRALGPGLEGPNGNDFLGPQIDISTSEGNGINIAKVVFEVDASLARPGHVTGYPFGYQAVRPGQRGEPGGMSFVAPDDQMAEYGFQEKLPNGDYRLTTTQIFNNSSVDLLQQSWFVFGYGMDDDLTEALRKGMSVWMKTNYHSAESWKVTVSSAVARALKLKSSTVGKDSFPKPGGKNRRIRLSAAFRKALRKYDRVVVKLALIAKGPDGEVQRDSRSVTLKRPESELG